MNLLTIYTKPQFTFGKFRENVCRSESHTLSIVDQYNQERKKRKPGEENDSKEIL